MMVEIGFGLLAVAILIAVVWRIIRKKNNQDTKFLSMPNFLITIIGIACVIGITLIVVDLITDDVEPISFSGETSSESSSTKDAYGHNRSYAIVIAEDVVKSKLKSPSTADFCSNYEYTVSRSKNTWTIKGYVDAQNSFGAMLRSDFTVKITFTGKSSYIVDLCSIS